MSDEALQLARKRLAETTSAITRLLVEDLITYPERELQRRFVASEASDSLSDDQVATLRKAAKDLGHRFADELQDKLAHDDVWLDLVERGELPEDRKSLRGVPAVWRLIQAIDPQLEQLASQAGLPADDRTPAGYAPPARFIAHQHLPTLVEHYFKEVGRLRQIGQKLDVQWSEQRRKSRADRWGSAE